MRDKKRTRRTVGSRGSPTREGSEPSPRSGARKVDDSPRPPEDEVPRLRRENSELRNRLLATEEDSGDFASRYVQVERMNSDLIKLYVASRRLHSTIDFDRVLQAIREIVVHMVGAERFSVDFVDERGTGWLRLAQEGMTAGETRGGEDLAGPALKAVQSGRTYVAPLGRADRRDRGPMACVPLRFEGRTMGLLTIEKLFGQKNELLPVDLELFELLSEQAATALLCARSLGGELGIRAVDAARDLPNGSSRSNEGR